MNLQGVEAILPVTMGQNLRASTIREEDSNSDRSARPSSKRYATEDRSRTNQYHHWLAVTINNIARTLAELTVRRVEGKERILRQGL